MVHELKIWPDEFEAIQAGLKTFEDRINNRNFQLGNVLKLREYFPNPFAESGKYSGREVNCQVMYIPNGWCIVSMKRLNEKED